MIQNKDYYIEIYKGKRFKRGFLLNTPEEATQYLLSWIHCDDVADIVDHLVAQKQNPQAFPNVILFLDDDQNLMQMNDYIDKWKQDEN